MAVAPDRLRVGAFLDRLVQIRRVRNPQQLRVEHVPAGFVQKTTETNVRRLKTINGSPSKTRTCDILVNSQTLYQLSYRGIS